MVSYALRFLRPSALFLALLCAFFSVSAAQANYRIQPGDVLSVEVLQDGDLNRSVLVLPDGSINFPLAGTVRASGRTVSQVQRNLVTKLEPNFAAPPTVFVSVTQLAPKEDPVAPVKQEPETFPVYVTGEVNNSGRLDVEYGITILQAIAQAGGITRFAAERRIELRRPDPQTGYEVTYFYSYNRKASGKRISGGTMLLPGDVVVVPERRLFE
jgi:polysaccharide export outer membrane protein